ncbi:hypothetical protein [Nocardia brasiliensis]|uniref:hypothetical protein n=1 Tax=Nocardia brasiliensis TaxID=37326 RepID=UPI003D9042B7
MNIDELLQTESEAIESDPDAPITPKSKVTRGHDRVKKLQIRLNEDEYERIEQLAESQGIPASTLARSLLLAAIGAETASATDPSAGDGIDDVVARIARMSKDIAFVQARVLTGLAQLSEDDRLKLTKSQSAQSHRKHSA